MKKKKLIVIGDSITKGTYTGINDKYPASIARPNFTDAIAKHFDLEYINYGMNGVSISSLSPQLPEWAICKQTETYESADIVVVAAGTNDWGGCVPFGNKKDKMDCSFYGALYLLYSKIKEKYKNSIIFVITPILREGESKNKKGNSLQQYREIIKSRAEEFGFIAIDGESIPINPENERDRDSYILDGTHPNVAGHRLLSEHLIKAMEKFLNKLT